MKIFIFGLDADEGSDHVTAALTTYFRVSDVSFVREGSGQIPWVIAQLEEEHEYVWSVCNRLRGMFHRGRRLDFYIPLHQD